MVYSIVHIRRCYLGDEYLQNNFDNILFHSEREVKNYISKNRARKLGGACQNCVPDITGHIINERGDIYGYLDDNDETHYFAVVELEPTRRNKFLNQE